MTRAAEQGVRAPPPVRYRRVRLVAGGVPASRIADVNQGILLPLSGTAGFFATTP